MALNETLTLDITSAQRQIDALERQLSVLETPINVPFETPGLEQIEARLKEAEQAAAELTAESKLLAASVGNVEADVKGLAAALNISEAEAEQLVTEFAQGRIEVNRLEAATREVATALGLSKADAAALQRELRGAATAADRTGNELESAGRRGAGGFALLEGSIGKAAAGLAAFVGVREVIKFFGDTINAASDLEESISKSTVVFGSFNDEIQDFAATAPAALGLSTQAAVEATATFGNLFVALGLSQGAAAELAPDIVQLGADLASFNNIDVSDALDKLRAGLVGEAEPLRVLGVNINAAVVEAKALELGLVSVTGEVSEAAKVQARYALILEQTQTAQGDFARTADGLANTQRTLTAEWENAQAVIGQALVPAVQGAIPILVSLAETLGVVGIEFGIAVGNIEEGAGRLQILAIQSGQAAGSATLLAGAVLDLQENLALAANKGDDFLQTNEDLVAGIEQLVAAWDGSSGETQTLIDNLDELVTTFGLTEEAAAVLRRELEQRRLTAFAEEEDIALLNNIARAVGGIRYEFQETGPLLSGFGADLEAIGQLEPIDTTAFDANLAEIAAMFDELPNAMDAAGAALRNEENEIVTDFSEFLDELGAQLEAQQAFTSNLGILEALGFSDLADTFRQLGLDSAAALADAVANPEEAARAQQLLERSAREQAAAFNQAFIAALDPDLSVDVRANLIIDQLGLAGQVRDAGEIVVNGGRGGVTSGTTIINNYTSPQIPPNDISRNNQVIRAIVRS